MRLQACPDCSRQYDVTHLETGRIVHCLCDALFTVTPPPALGVEALTCEHCGAPVGSEHADCPYCGAALSEQGRRHSTLCPQCFARIADDSRHCNGCGVEIRPQALSPIPEGKACPRCRETLRSRALGRTDVIECSSCLGLWLPPRVFEEACRRAETGFDRARYGGAERSGEAGSPPGSADSRRVTYIPCLTCGQRMLRRQFRHGTRPTGVIVDYCRDHGIWLDHTELERIVEAVRTGGGAAATRGATDEGFFPRPGKPASRAAPPMPVSGSRRRRPDTTPLESAVSFLADVVGSILTS